jgi:hypothetical protein
VVIITGKAQIIAFFNERQWAVGSRQWEKAKGKDENRCRGNSGAAFINPINPVNLINLLVNSSTG